MERPTPPNMNADTAVEAPTYTHAPLAKNGSLFQTLQKLLKEEEAPPPVGKKTRVNRRNHRRTTAKARRN